MSSAKYFLLAALLVASTYCLFPHPASIRKGDELIPVCSIEIAPHSSIDFNTQFYLEKITSRRLSGVSCTNNQLPLKLSIVKDTNVIKHKEGYSLSIKKQGVVRIHVASYNGYVYAMETLSQLIYQYKGQVPVVDITDEPAVVHRGIMIDVSRHFISVQKLKRTIGIMAMTKLNILHLKFTADESFAIESLTHPELSQSGAYSSSETYTVQILKDLIKFAQVHGVSIIPEIDTPAAARSWTLSPTWKSANLTIACANEQKYNHIMDVSKEKVYELVKEVIQDIDVLFKDSPYIHLGADLINTTCWETAAIKTFMTVHHIESYKELKLHWKTETRRAVQPDRKVVYWFNNATEEYLDREYDVYQYYGDTTKIPFIPDGKSKIILSPKNLLALGSGQGSYDGDVYGFFPSWRMIYEKFELFPANIDRDRILGAEVTLDTHVCNEDTLDNMLWMRAAVFAERVWTIFTTRESELVRRIYDLEAQIMAFGTEPTPMVTEFCEVNPEVCY